ncbi:MAG: hypothetical protein ACJAS4_002131 [Bacteriovoracaceae bacterium]|jgi:hypothetical protein
MVKKTDTPDDMIGFKDFIDPEAPLPKARPKRDTSSGHEILTFLERESTRLSKIITLCEEKSFNLKRFPQSGKINELAQEQLDQLKSDMIQRLRTKDSPLTLNIKELLENHFSS